MAGGDTGMAHLAQGRPEGEKRLGVGAQSKETLYCCRVVEGERLWEGS